jgi:hypothetical protein
MVIDSLRTELEPYLTPEQMKKLEKCIGCKGETCSPKKIIVKWNKGIRSIV